MGRGVEDRGKEWLVECEGWFGVGGLGGYIVVTGVLRRNSRPHQYP